MKLNRSKKHPPVDSYAQAREVALILQDSNDAPENTWGKVVVQEKLIH